MIRRTRIQTVLLAGACAAALALAACGGDDETSTTTDAGATGADSSADLGQTREEFIAGALEAVASNGAVSDAKTECLQDELETRLTDEVLQDLIAAGGTSPQALELAVAAGRACQDVP